MLTLETAIAKICQLPPAKQKLVILLIEYLDKETARDRRELLKEELETAINNAENISLVDRKKLITSIFQD